MLHWLHYYRAQINLALRRTDGAIAAYRDAFAANPRFALATAGAVKRSSHTHFQDCR